MSNNLAFNIFTYISIFSVLIPFTAGLARIKTFDNVLKVLFFYVLLSILSDSSSLILANKGIHNYFVRNIYTVLECTCFAYIYFNKFSSTRIKRIILRFYGFYLALFIATFAYKGNINTSDNILSTLEAIAIIIVGHIYTFMLFKSEEIDVLEDDSFFWINNAILIYFSANIILFLFYGYIEKFEIHRYYLLHSLHLISNISFNLILAFGIWKVRAS